MPLSITHSRRAVGAALLGALAAPAPAQVPADSAVIGAFFHSTETTLQEDLAHVADLRAFGLNTWLPLAYDQGDLDAWMSAAESAGVQLIHTFLGNVSPDVPNPDPENLNL